VLRKIRKKIVLRMVVEIKKGNSSDDGDPCGRSDANELLASARIM
jgi:hypothetical protein